MGTGIRLGLSARAYLCLFISLILYPLCFFTPSSCSPLFICGLGNIEFSLTTHDRHLLQSHLVCKTNPCLFSKDACLLWTSMITQGSCGGSSGRVHNFGRSLT